MSAPWPAPTLRGEERIWFDGAAQGRLVFQLCDDCGAAIAYPRTVCPSCMSSRLTVTPSAGRGVVHSFTVQYRAGHASRADDVPYVIVLVDLDEGVRVLADLVGVAPDGVAVGLPVEAWFDEVADGLTVPRFRPVATGEAG